MNHVNILCSMFTGSTSYIHECLFYVFLYRSYKSKFPRLHDNDHVNQSHFFLVARPSLARQNRRWIRRKKPMKEGYCIWKRRTPNLGVDVLQAPERGAERGEREREWEERKNLGVDALEAPERVDNVELFPPKRLGEGRLHFVEGVDFHRSHLSGLLRNHKQLLVVERVFRGRHPLTQRNTRRLHQENRLSLFRVQRVRRIPHHRHLHLLHAPAHRIKPPVQLRHCLNNTCSVP